MTYPWAAHERLNAADLNDAIADLYTALAVIEAAVASVQPNFTPAGTGAVTRTSQNKLRESPLSAADFGTADTLQTAASSLAYLPVALRTQFRGPDQAPQFEVGWTPNAVNYVRMVGGISGGGVTHVAAGTDTNIDINHTAKGIGGHYFGNGAGLAFSILDNGLGVLTSEAVTVKGSASGTNPILGATRSLTYNVATGFEHDFRVNDQAHFKIRNVRADATIDNWWEFGGSQDGSAIRFEATGDGASGVTSMFFRARGNAGITLATTLGNMAVFQSLDGSAGANYPQFRSSATGVPIRIQAVGETNTAMRLTTSGTGDLTLEGYRSSITAGFATAGLQTFTPVAAGAITVLDSTAVLAMRLGGAIAGYTVTMPAAPIAGQRVTLTTNGTITGFSAVANAGHTLAGSPATLDAATPVSFIFIATSNAWMRV